MIFAIVLAMPKPLHEIVAKKAHEHWKEFNPDAKLTRVQQVSPGIQGVFARPVAKDGKLDVPGTIKAMQERSSGKYTFTGAVAGNEELDKVMRPVQAHVEANPHLFTPEFRANLKKAVGMLESAVGRGERLITYTGKEGLDHTAKIYHEVTHDQINQAVGEIDTTTREGVRTNEGLTSYLELTLSGAHNGKTFEEAVKPLMDDEHREEYGEPAKMLHGMLSTGEKIREGVVDKQKLANLLKEIKKGKSIDRIREEWRAIMPERKLTRRRPAK
jgi:hypothetical protein